MTLGNSLKIHNLYMALKCPLNKASFRSTTVDAAAGPPQPDQLRFYAFCSVLMNESPLPRLMRDSEWLDSDSPAPVTWSMIVTVVIAEWRI